MATSTLERTCCLARMLRDLEQHEPGIGFPRLNAETAAAWKQCITTKSIRPGNGDAEISLVTVPRINAIERMITVRSF